MIARTIGRRRQRSIDRAIGRRSPRSIVHRPLIATTSPTISYDGSCHRYSPIVRDSVEIDRGMRPLLDIVVLKHCRSVAPCPNRNQSYDPEIVRSGVTVNLQRRTSSVHVNPLLKVNAEYDAIGRHAFPRMITESVVDYISVLRFSCSLDVTWADATRFSVNRPRAIDYLNHVLVGGTPYISVTLSRVGIGKID